MAQDTARILDSTCAVERGWENERTTPRATFRRGKLSLQSNEIFGRTNPIPERSRRRANCAQAFVAGPAVFPLYFQRASRRSERHVATRIPLGLVPLEANQIISKDGIVTSGRRLRRCPPQVVAVGAYCDQ